MIHKIQVTILILLIPGLLLYTYMKREDLTLRDLFSPQVSVVTIDGIPIQVEVVNDPLERSQGLSNRDVLGPNDGMLFVFEESDYHQMWMKDMRFSIDIIWISEDLEVVSVDRAVHPNTYPRTFRPSRPAKYAIETNERFTDTFSIAVGDEVVLPSGL